MISIDEIQTALKNHNCNKSKPCLSVVIVADSIILERSYPEDFYDIGDEVIRSRRIQDILNRIKEEKQQCPEKNSSNTEHK